MVTGLLVIAGLAYIGSFAAGTISIYVRDAPVNWKQLNVVFSDIQIHRAAAGNDSDWTSLPLSSPTIDFVALGNLTKLLALDRAAAGKYTQLRLVVDSVSGILANGTHVTLTVPDHVLKTTLPFNIPGSGSVSVTLDFDLASSIHAADGQWIFRPVLGSIQVS
jgi:Domain of unknown function (DUF4382)